MYVNFLIFGFLFIASLSFAAWLFAKYLYQVFADGEWGDRYGKKLTGWLMLPSVEQHWTSYLKSLLVFNAAGVAALLAILFFQDHLPWNPQNFAPMDWNIIIHTAISFITGTNLQAYVPEISLSYFSQSVGLATQHFLSAATGMCGCLIFIRAFARDGVTTIGNFWNDLLRGVFFVLLPISIIAGCIFAAQGMPQNFDAYIDTGSYSLPQGPVASQSAIKIFGGNGGGFFAANSAHPYENPSLITNYLQLGLILLLPMALIFLLGEMLRKPKEAMVLYAAVTLLFLGNFTVLLFSELYAGGSGYVMEGKEQMFGVLGSALWASATTATANGSANMAVASLNPLSIFIMLMQIQLGEVFYGGIGSGFYTLILFALLSVFVAALMIGRSPEYLGKKIEVFEMKATMMALLVYPVLIFTGIGAVMMHPDCKKWILNNGTMGFTEVLYAFSSAAGNNGSAMGGFNMTDPFVSYSLGIVMLLGRFLPMIAVTAIAGHLAAKKRLAPSIATLSTATPTFLFMLCFMILMLGALTYFPALTLGPVADYLALTEKGVLYAQ